MHALPRVATAAAIVAMLCAPGFASAQTETVEYYALDAIGSVRVVFDVSGNVIGRMDYDPFGAPLSSGTGLPSRAYAGLFRDGEAGLDFAQARSYQARTGRFSTVDPIYAGLFEPQAWNRYAYALNAPIAYADASGLLAEPFRSTSNPGCERFPAMCQRESQRDEDGGGGGPSLSMLLFLGGYSSGGSGSSGSFEPTAGRGKGPSTGTQTPPGPTPPGPTPPGPTPPGPTPPGPTPPTGPSPAESKPKSAVKVLQCAATTAQSINAAWLLGVDDTKTGQILGGNDFASGLEWIFGPDRWQGGVDVTTGRALQISARIGMHAKVKQERIPLRERAGRFESIRYYNGSLARTTLGGQVLKWGARLSLGKAVYDAGTLLGSLGVCAGVL
jgi:RHS repeat-associated protein